jgi:hypothetical protein
LKELGLYFAAWINTSEYTEVTGFALACTGGTLLMSIATDDRVVRRIEKFEGNTGRLIKAKAKS